MQAPGRRRRRLRRPRRDEGVRFVRLGKGVVVEAPLLLARAVAQDGEERGQDALLQELLDERVVRLEESERGQRADLVLEADVLDDDVDEPEELVSAGGRGEGRAGALRAHGEPAEVDDRGVERRGVRRAQVHREPGEGRGTEIRGGEGVGGEGRRGDATRRARRGEGR